jgi:GNAT superfamily N-acetyltransferase
MADNPEVAQQGSLSSHLSGLVPKAVLDSAPGRFATAAFDNSSIGAKANLAKEYWNSVTTPSSEPGGNIINDMATSLWHAHAAEFNKADDLAKAAQNSHSFGDWASNTSQSVGHLAAAALPLVGPAAAQAGERIGKGDVAGGLGAGTGLIASTLIGGSATSKASKLLGAGEKEAAMAGKVAGNVPGKGKVLEMPKPKLEPVYKATTEPGELLHKHTVEVHLPGEADKVGHVKAVEEADKPGSWRIDESELHPDLRGQGIGKGAYERLIQHAQESGAHEIHSGGVVSPEAAKVWEGLSKKYPVDRVSMKDPKTGDIHTTYRLKLDKDMPSLTQGAHLPPPKNLRGAAKVLSMPAPPEALPKPSFFDHAMNHALNWADDKMAAHMAGKPNTFGKFADAVEKHIVRPDKGVYTNEGGDGIHLVQRD